MKNTNLKISMVGDSTLMQARAGSHCPIKLSLINEMHNNPDFMIVVDAKENIGQFYKYSVIQKEKIIILYFE